MLVVAAIAGIVYLVTAQSQMDAALQKQESTETPDAETVENPIDFATLQAENADIYAWIYIPNTNVNLPIVQSATDDGYYLDHDETGEFTVAGAIFTQKANSTDFTDPVTVIYGHNMANDSMFGTLSNFEDEQFFNDNEYFYIYTPDSILTYQIVSAYQYDNRHILNSFNFSNASEREEYFNYVLNPTSLIKNVREGVEQLSTDDRIVQLSTCRGDSNVRYLVTGVLVDEQATS